MKKEYKDALIAGYVNNLSAIESLTIKALTIGFVVDDCNTNLFHILIECMKHIELFDEEQTVDIINIINKLSLHG